MIRWTVHKFLTIANTANVYVHSKDLLETFRCADRQTVSILSALAESKSVSKPSNSMNKQIYKQTGDQKYRQAITSNLLNMMYFRK